MPSPTCRGCRWNQPTGKPRAIPVPQHPQPGVPGGQIQLGRGHKAVAFAGGQEILLPTLERDLRVRAGRARRGEALRGGVGLGPRGQERFPGQGEPHTLSVLLGTCPAAQPALPCLPSQVVFSVQGLEAAGQEEGWFRLWPDKSKPREDE